MKFELNPVCQIKREATFRDGLLEHILVAQKIQEETIFYGVPEDNSSAKVQVDTRFANPPGSNPTLHHDLRFVGASGTREGQPPLERQRELLERIGRTRIPCGSCALLQRALCGLDKMKSVAVGTDTRYDTSSQNIIGLNFAISLPAGTQASEVKCIQP